MPYTDPDPTPADGITLTPTERAFIDLIERYARPPARVGDLRIDVVRANLRDLAIDLDLGDDRRSRYVWAAYLALGGTR